MAGLGDIMSLMGNLGSIRKKAEAMQEELGRLTAEGSAGGGMVRATVNGRQELVGLKIDPEAVNRDDVALLEDLVKSAVTQAMDKARDLQKEAAAKMIGDLPLPPGVAGMLGM